MTNTLFTSQQITDDLVRQLNSQNESQVKEDEVIEGEVVDDTYTASAPVAPIASGLSPEKDLRTRIESGEWDNLDDLEAFKSRTPEGQLMCRTEAIDFRVRQLELRMPTLLNEHLHEAYIQILKKIHALRKTKSALLFYFYKNDGQRDLGSG